MLLSCHTLLGKGLGKAENGISEAIKVKVKCNKGGVRRKAFLPSVLCSMCNIFSRQSLPTQFLIIYLSEDFISNHNHAHLTIQVSVQLRKILIRDKTCKEGNRVGDHCPNCLKII